MMQAIQISRLDLAIEKRRATKYFDQSFKICSSQLGKLISSAACVNHPFPTIPFKLVRVSSGQSREKLAKIGFSQPQFTEASELLLICADRDVISAQGSAIKLSAEQVQDQSMFWCALFSQGLQITAAAYGYDSCPMIGFDFLKAREIFEIPSHWAISNIVALGVRAKAPHPKGSKLNYKDVIFADKNKLNDSITVM